MAVEPTNHFVPDRPATQMGDYLRVAFADKPPLQLLDRPALGSKFEGPLDDVGPVHASPFDCDACVQCKCNQGSSLPGMSAKQIERKLGVTYKTAWFLFHRIREAMSGAVDNSPLGGPGMVIESDEAFIGDLKKKRLSGKVAPKKKVLTLVERAALVLKGMVGRTLTYRRIGQFAA